MSRMKIILFAAEILAVAALRVTYMVRRDRMLPRGSKVSRIKNKPVFRMGANVRQRDRQIKDTPDLEIAGWTPPPKRDRIEPTPGSSPDA